MPVHTGLGQLLTTSVSGSLLSDCCSYYQIVASNKTHAASLRLRLAFSIVRIWVHRWLRGRKWEQVIVHVLNKSMCIELDDMVGFPFASFHICVPAHIPTYNILGMY